MKGDPVCRFHPFWVAVVYFSLVAAYWPVQGQASSWVELPAGGWAARYCWVLERIQAGRQAVAELAVVGVVVAEAVAWQAAERAVEPVGYWAEKAVRNGYPAGCPEERAGCRVCWARCYGQAR
jgi:hypothetical protein